MAYYWFSDLSLSERLIGGEMILKEINQELTYGELDACPDSYADYHTAEGNL